MVLFQEVRIEVGTTAGTPLSFAGKDVWFHHAALTCYHDFTLVVIQIISCCWKLFFCFIVRILQFSVLVHEGPGIQLTLGCDPTSVYDGSSVYQEGREQRVRVGCRDGQLIFPLWWQETVVPYILSHQSH